MAIGDALTAPTGVQNQMVGQPSRVPGYDQGYAQAPGMPRPTQPNPMGRPTAVVGGPAYFTPEGYNAPPQPTQAFMPTDRAPDPIGDQFMRQMQSPMGQQYQQQYEATQAPIREAEMAQRAEQQAAQDARFQEMMDRIAELEGQLSQPTEPTPPTTPMPGDDSFINLPDFLGNLDFSGLPANLGNLDFGQIIKKYQDRMNSGEPEPIESFLPNPRDLPPMGPMPVMDEPRFTTMPVGPRGPGMSIEDMLEGRVTRMPVGDPYGAILNNPFSIPFKGEINEAALQAIQSPGSKDFRAPRTPQAQAPAPVLPMGLNPPLNMSFNAAKSGSAPVVQAPMPMPAPNYIPNIPSMDFSNLPKAGGMPSMDFSNLRNFSRR